MTRTTAHNDRTRAEERMKCEGEGHEHPPASGEQPDPPVDSSEPPYTGVHNYEGHRPSDPNQTYAGFEREDDVGESDDGDSSG